MFEIGGIATRLTESRHYDYLNRLLEIRSVPSSTAQFPIGYSYRYNSANQRERTTLADGSYWVYRYDDLGQVISGRKYWVDGLPVPGAQYEYGFDEIGNRLNASFGGDENGLNLNTTTYTPNLLNQYSDRTVPPVFIVSGIANPAATVTVSGVPATYRRGEYFWKELSTSNEDPVWQNSTVQAVNGGSSTTVAGNIFIPEDPEVYSHDADGNLTADGRWNYAWDAENRLIRMVARTLVGPQQRLDFEYDAGSRRIRKKVWNNTSGTGTAATDTKFVYDGWNWIAELNALSANAVLRSYVWGNDLSGTRQGAGGVGGLLAVRSGSVCHFTAYDGNGNVVALVDGSNGIASANYEYGPFGEPIRASGSMGRANPFRFSTKFVDDETGLSYYGFRYYDPTPGRWISRDPIEENGGVNLCQFAFNNPLSYSDPSGLDPSLYAPWEFDGPFGPTMGTQINPWGYFGDYDEQNFTEWFDQRFPNTLEEARQTLESRIKALACQNADQQPPVLPNLDNKNNLDYDLSHGRNVGRWLDPKQGWFQRRFELGDFEVQADEIRLTNWRMGQCAPCFDYKAKVYVLEQAGVGKGEPEAILSFIARKRYIRMAEWTISGAHCCDQ